MTGQNNDNESRSLVIVGAGITGLCCAFIASRNGYSVTILEKSGNVGGLLDCFDIEGTHIEKFYHHFFLQDTALHWFLRELDIEGHLQYYDSSMGICMQNKELTFGKISDLLSIPSLSLFDKVRYILSTAYLGLFASWRKHENTVALKWLRKWAGKNLTLKMWEPLFMQKFGVTSNKIPLSWLIGRLRQRIKSRQKEGEKLGYIRGSLKIMLNNILAKLHENNVRICLETPAQNLIVQNNEVKGVRTAKGDFYAHQILLTTPSNISSSLIRSHNISLANMLSESEYFKVIVVVLTLRESLIDHYWLNIADTSLPFTVIVEHTRLVGTEDYNGKHLVYLSRYFYDDENLISSSDDQVYGLFIDGIQKLKPGFDLSLILERHIFRSSTAAILCDLNYSSKIPSCKTEISGLYLANMSHIYPDERSINNNIVIAQKACVDMGVLSKIKTSGISLAGQFGFTKKKKDEG